MWLEPDLPTCVRTLHEKKIESVLVVAPGFAFDCTETVVEIGRDMRRRFMRKGKFFELIDCLNDSERQIWLLLRNHVTNGRKVPWQGPKRGLVAHICQNCGKFRVPLGPVF